MPLVEAIAVAIACGGGRQPGSVEEVPDIAKGRGEGEASRHRRQWSRHQIRCGGRSHASLGAGQRSGGERDTTASDLFSIMIILILGFVGLVF